MDEENKRKKKNAMGNMTQNHKNYAKHHSTPPPSITGPLRALGIVGNKLSLYGMRLAYYWDRQWEITVWDWSSNEISWYSSVTKERKEKLRTLMSVAHTLPSLLGSLYIVISVLPFLFRANTPIPQSPLHQHSSKQTENRKKGKYL